MTKAILFLSNGHGEDLNGSLILEKIRQFAPNLNIAAMPLVGAGNAYIRLDVPIIGPTATLPSGGIIYTNPLNWIKDIWSGLIGLTWRQIRAVLRYSPQCDLLVAVGDIVPIVLAYLTRRPYVAFIVSTSSYYEGRLRLPWITELCLRSSRCLAVFTRDNFTAIDLQQKGMKKAIFAGYPIMDVLEHTGKNLLLSAHLPMIALLPGSRVPEAVNNLGLQLKLCEQIAQLCPVQFRAALVNSITDNDLESLAIQTGWQYKGEGYLVKNKVEIYCYWDAFPDILHQCNLALGMAGTAVEQAVGLGKPVIQIPGAGPQFTYPFAEAQMRLLGISVKTIGRKPTESNLSEQVAQEVLKVLKDTFYLNQCVNNGKERVGDKGGSEQIARNILDLII